MTKTLDYDAVDDLDDLRVSWSGLVQGIAGVAFFHRWEWHRALADELLGGDVRYHCFYERGQLIAVFPFRSTLQVRRPPPHRALEAPSHVEIFLGDALIRDDHIRRNWVTALERIVAAETDPPELLRFDRVPERSCLRRCMRGLRGRVHQEAIGGSHFCDVAGPDSLASLSRKHVHNVERLGRRAARELGAVERGVFAGVAAATTGLDTFVSVEECGWKGPSGKKTSLSCTPRSREFYRKVLHAFGRTQDARVDVLYIGGVPAAAQIALRSGVTWSLLKIGYDERFAAFGPGNVLLLMFLEEMSRTPDVDRVSLVTAPEWADRWHLALESTYEIRVFGANARARMLSFLLTLRELGRGARGALAKPHLRDAG